MRNRTLFTIGLVAALTLTACGESTGGTVNTQTAEKATAPITIGVLRTMDSLPVYVGDHNGLFQEYGADVELVEFGSASDQSKAMESGAIDAMMTDMVVQTLIQKGGKEMKTVAVALGADVKEGKFLVVSNEKAGISSIGEMAGKSVAISEGTMMEYLVDSYCKELDVDLNTIEKVNIPSLSLRYETLMAGEVDMAILPDPMGDLAVMNGGKAVIDDTTLDRNLSCSVIAFSKEFIENNEAEVECFLDGYNAAIDRINEAHEEDLEFIYSVANVPEVMQSTWTVTKFTEKAVPSKEQVDDLMQWMVEKALIDEAYEYSEIVDDSFCKEAQ